MPNKEYTLNCFNLSPILFFIVIFFISFFVFTNKVNALTLDKNSYVSGEQVSFIDEGGPFLIFNGSGSQVGGDYSYAPGLTLNQSVPFGRGNYKIIEFTTFNDLPCFLGLSYDECKQAPEFVAEFLFTITPASNGDGGADFDPPLDSELTPMGNLMAGYIQNYVPEVNVFSILKNAIFSDNLNIDYKATDQNDSDNTKSYNGLKDNPVSIFFSDKIANLYDNFLGSTNKTAITKDQPAEGSYKWSVKNLIPGVLYKIIVEAIDKSGLWGQSLSEYFSVDFTAPVFNIKVNPNAVRSGDVSISIDSSEDLSDLPQVKVTQNGSEAKTVILKGNGSHYEGVYTVVPGFDGTAVISISGSDMAGNKGDIIISGGTFSVGMNPPPKPKINNYVEKFTTDKEFIDISGITRSDTEAVISLNGAEISKVKPDKIGNFTFSKVQLDKKKNKGINYVNISSVDQLGTKGEGVLMEIKYNIPPVVKIVKPINEDTLNNIAPITVEGSDENMDNIFYTYQILSKNDFNNKVFNWINISENNPSSSFSWNTSEMEDGDYYIEVVAFDGFAKTISNPVLVTIKNVLPYFIFEDGRNTVTNKSNVAIKGKVLTSTNLNPRPSISSLAYSMDGGSTWAPLKVTSVSGDYEKKFAVSFSNLKEGTYPILWRTKDSRGYIGKIIHPLIIDKTAPKSPIVTVPKMEKGIEFVINNTNDENLNKKGVQVNIKGKTEPYSTVNLIYNNQTIATKAFPTGDFSFVDVTFDQKGRYNLSLSATDLAGNNSPSISIPILYNNPPVISIINPKPFRGLSDKADVSWNIKDIDGDPINSIVVSYRNKDKDIVFKNLVTNANAVGNYIWDTSTLPESNNYELKVTASDGYVTNSLVVSFSIDRTPPVLTSFVFNKNQTNINDKNISFLCSGEEEDSISGIEFVEYRVESSDSKTSPWYKGVITSGYMKNKATFNIKHPILVSDGEYKVYARAVDASGNISSPLSLSLFVDKVAPRIGSFFFKKDGVNLNPDEVGNISIYKNSNFNFNISLESDTENASIKIGSKSFDLKKDDSSGLWNTDIYSDGDSVEKIYITAQDGSGNIIKDKEIGGISFISRGYVYYDNNSKEFIVGADIHMLKLNKDTGQYNDFMVSNNNTDIISNNSGEYEATLPAGEYKFIISKSDIDTLRYSLILDRPSIVNSNFKVTKSTGIMRFINKFLEIFR